MDTIDAECVRLAEHFLDDDDTNTQKTAGVHHKRVDSLARSIQSAVEDWIEDEIDRLDATA